MKENKLDLSLRRIWVVLSAVALFINFAYGFENSMIFTGVLVLGMSVHMFYCYRKYTGLFIMMFFILYSNYSILMRIHFFPELRPAFFWQLSNAESYAKALSSILCFEATLVYMSIHESEYCKRGAMLTDNYVLERYTRSDELICYICIAAYIIIFATQFSFGEGSERAKSSPLLEYRSIVLTVGLLFGKRNKAMRNIWAVVIIVTTLITFMGGNRANALSSVIVFIVYNMPRVKRPLILTAAIVGVTFLLICVGAMRTGITLEKEALSMVWEKIQHEKLSFDTAVFAYFPAVGTIEVSDMGNINRLKSLLEHILYIFMGGKYGQRRWGFVIEKYYTHFYGFVSPIYFYPWLHVFSGIAMGLIVNGYMKLYLKMLNRGQLNDLVYGMFLYFCAMTPRWYLYDPFPMIRGMMIYVIFYFVMKFCEGILTCRPNMNK